MKISELINELYSYQNNYGDILVRICPISPDKCIPSTELNFALSAPENLFPEKHMLIWGDQAKDWNFNENHPTN